ncbi:hypothetical protein FJ251_00015 [bacterium]|nr:hypothetical protein [bacterium]
MRLATLLTVGLLLIAATAVAEKTPYNYPIVDHPLDRQGGDTVASATPITVLPFSGSGSTIGYGNDYDAVCPYNLPGAPDVVYSLVPCLNGVLEITLCAASAYDTKLYVLDSGLNVIACNDDFCPGYVSELTYASGSPVAVTAGSLYYIVVDGWSPSDMGYYTIDITGMDCTTAVEETSFGTVKSLY